MHHKGVWEARKGFREIVFGSETAKVGELTESGLILVGVLEIGITKVGQGFY